jgi:hypothetical protein
MVLSDTLKRNIKSATVVTVDIAQGKHVTTAAETILKSLPKQLAATIERVSKKTGETPIAIIRKGVALYEKRLHVKSVQPLDENSKLARITKDPDELALFQRVVSAMATRSNATMTKAQLIDRAKKGAAARWSKKKDRREKES